MNNEETVLDPQQTTEQGKETVSAEQPKADEKKNLGWGEKAAYAAGGAVVGAAATMAGQAAAAPKAEVPEEEKQAVKRENRSQA